MISPSDIAKQKRVDSSAGGASVLMGSWREPLRLTLNVSKRKKLHSLLVDVARDDIITAYLLDEATTTSWSDCHLKCGFKLSQETVQPVEKLYCRALRRRKTSEISLI